MTIFSLCKERVRSDCCERRGRNNSAEWHTVSSGGIWWESASRRFTHTHSNTTRIQNTRQKERLHCFNYFLAAATITAPHRDRITPRQQKLFHIQKLGEMWKSDKTGDTTQSTATLFIRRPNREHGARVIISVGERSDESMNGRISSQSACACARPAAAHSRGGGGVRLRSGRRHSIGFNNHKCLPTLEVTSYKVNTSSIKSTWDFKTIAVMLGTVRLSECTGHRVCLWDMTVPHNLQIT